LPFSLRAALMSAARRASDSAPTSITSASLGDELERGGIARRCARRARGRRRRGARRGARGGRPRRGSGREGEGRLALRDAAAWSRAAWASSSRRCGRAAAGRSQSDDHVGGEVGGDGLQGLVVRGEKALGAEEGAAGLDVLEELLHLRAGEVRRRRRGRARCASRAGALGVADEGLAHGVDEELLDGADGALPLGVEELDGEAEVVVELDARGPARARRPHVDDGAAGGEGAGVFHHGDAEVAALGEAAESASRSTSSSACTRSQRGPSAARGTTLRARAAGDATSTRQGRPCERWKSVARRSIAVRRSGATST
jgi:hypothetical protein